MAETLFIADLHLSPKRPDITALFVDFLQTRARGTAGLYILGDLFEMWLGDDVSLPEQRDVICALRQLTSSGVPCYFLHGNRDFTVGGQFALNSGVAIIDDPTVIELDGKHVLISHGDQLCTDDVGYQRLRRVIRNPLVLKMLFSLSANARRWVGDKLRGASKQSQQAKIATPSIMDVNQQAVEAVMAEHQVRHLIHGHTHRPKQHHFELNGQAAERHVLGDWYNQGSLLACNNGVWALETMSFLD